MYLTSYPLTMASSAPTRSDKSSLCTGGHVGKFCEHHPVYWGCNIIKLPCGHTAVLKNTKIKCKKCFPDGTKTAPVAKRPTVEEMTAAARTKPVVPNRPTPRRPSVDEMRRQNRRLPSQRWNQRVRRLNIENPIGPVEKLVPRSRPEMFKLPGMCRSPYHRGLPTVHEGTTQVVWKPHAPTGHLLIK